MIDVPTLPDEEDRPVGIKDMTPEEIAKLPFAKWRGKIDIGEDDLDCYVLDDERRVLSSGSTTKAIANVERGSLQDYIGQKALNPFIDKEKMLQETIRFSIPGTQWAAIGITTEQFELICRGYVQALYQGARVGSACAEFSWEGHDDTDPACGRGWAVIGTAGRLVGHFYIHNGDDSGFVCERN